MNDIMDQNADGGIVYVLTNPAMPRIVLATSEWVVSNIKYSDDSTWRLLGIHESLKRSVDGFRM
jgi:hypothetical protein